MRGAGEQRRKLRACVPLRGIHLNLGEEEAVGEIGPPKIGIPAVRPEEIGASQVGVPKIGGDQVSPSQVCDS